MMSVAQIRFEAEMQQIYRDFSFDQKVYFSRRLIKEGFIKNGPLLKSWWMEERISWFHNGTIEEAMEQFIDDNPSVLYLEDFDPEKLTAYRMVGKNRVQEIIRRKTIYLKNYDNDNK